MARPARVGPASGPPGVPVAALVPTVKPCPVCLLREPLGHDDPVAEAGQTTALHLCAEVRGVHREPEEAVAASSRRGARIFPRPMTCSKSAALSAPGPGGRSPAQRLAVTNGIFLPQVAGAAHAAASVSRAADLRRSGAGGDRPKRLSPVSGSVHGRPKRRRTISRRVSVRVRGMSILLAPRLRS